METCPVEEQHGKSRWRCILEKGHPGMWVLPAVGSEHVYLPAHHFVPVEKAPPKD